MASKKLTVVDYPMYDDLFKASGKLSNIKVDKRCKMEVTAELDVELYTAITKNPTWWQKLQDASMKKARAEIARMGSILHDADEQASRMRDDQVDALLNKLQAKFDSLCKDAGEETARFAEKMIEDYKKADKSLKNFRYRTAARIGVTALTVVPGIVVTAATGGTLAPLTIISAVKATVSVISELGKVFATADMAAKIIQKELLILRKVMSENKSVASRSVKEILLNLASKGTSLPLTSLRNCEERIDVHKEAIQKLRRKSKELSEQVYFAMDLAKDWNDIFKNAKIQNKAASTIGPIRTVLEKKEKALDTLLKKTIAVNEHIEVAEKRQESYEKTMALLQSDMPKWLWAVDASIAFAVDVGTGVGLTNDDVEKTLSALNALSQTMAEEGLVKKK